MNNRAKPWEPRTRLYALTGERGQSLGTEPIRTTPAQAAEWNRVLKAKGSLCRWTEETKCPR